VEPLEDLPAHQGRASHVGRREPGELLYLTQGHWLSVRNAVVADVRGARALWGAVGFSDEGVHVPDGIRHELGACLLLDLAQEGCQVVFARLALPADSVKQFLVARTREEDSPIANRRPRKLLYESSHSASPS